MRKRRWHSNLGPILRDIFKHTFMQCWFNAFWLAAQKFSTNQSFPNLRSVIYKGNSRYRYGTWGGTHLLRAIFTKYLSSKVPLRSRFRSMFKFNSRLKIVQSSSHYDSRLANYDRRVLSKSSSKVKWMSAFNYCLHEVPVSSI